jgi:hypothetical protein
MKKTIIFPVLLLFFVAGCSSKSSPQTGVNGSDGGAIITITATPRQGFAPLRISFRGELEGVEPNNEEYYCLQEEWDFGDGAISSEKPNCDPFSPDSRVKKEFYADHVYDTAGNFTVRLVLGDEKVRSRQISVVIVDRDRGYNE